MPIPRKRRLFVELLESRIALNGYFVSPTGNDMNAGTSMAPWLTLQHAADQLVAGDNVTVDVKLIVPEICPVMIGPMRNDGLSWMSKNVPAAAEKFPVHCCSVPGVGPGVGPVGEVVVSAATPTA